MTTDETKNVLAHAGLKWEDFLGWFKSEDNAGRAYNKVALTTYGDYSRLNIIVS